MTWTVTLPPCQPSHLLDLDLLGAVLEHVVADRGLEVNIQGVAGGHDVVVVDSLDEGLQGQF